MRYEAVRDFDVMNPGSSGETMEYLNFLIPISLQGLQTKTSKEQ